MQVISTDKRRTIVGMGLTGLSCARYFKSKDLPFRVVDSRQSPALLSDFKKEFPDVELYNGEFLSELFSSEDLLVVSPGVALTEPAIAEALSRGAELSSDIQLFVEATKSPIIAITGSNGKSTVTTLVGEMLKAAGKNAVVAGNIGLPVLEQLQANKDAEIFVLELSSFQLERLDKLNAKAACILNVTEDHMDRYESLQAYHAAKQKVFMGAENIIINRDDKLTETLENKKMQRIDYGLSSADINSFGLKKIERKEWIFFGTKPVVDVNDIKIKGRHNISNAMAAMALSYAVGIDWPPMITALKTFSGLPHRCQWVRDINQVSFYNDSKATNVGAAVAAISGFSKSSGNLILIAGGLDKDSDFEPLARIVDDAVEKVFLIGVDAKKIEVTISNTTCQLSSSLQEAVNDAYHFAEKGDVVLFAPACASFDMFKNYEDRGDAFMNAVTALEA